MDIGSQVDKVDKVDTFYKVFSFLDFRIGTFQNVSTLSTCLPLRDGE